MIKRYDVAPRELDLYPQYYQDKYFEPNDKGRFVLWADMPEELKLRLEGESGYVTP